MSDNKENIAPNHHRRKAVASSAFSPGKKCLKIMRSTMKQQISIRHDESTNEKDCPQSMKDMEMQFRDE
eukprot:scaffold2019_cov203-Alexandrium_tamarense.AAC.1